MLFTVEYIFDFEDSIEVKADNMIDDPVVKAKQLAAEEMATASEMHYLMYAGSRLRKENVLESSNMYTSNLLSE